MERSVSPTRNGLTKIFSKRSDRKKQSSSGNSIQSSESDSISGFRGSVEHAIDRLTRQDGSDDDDGATATIKKLIPKRLAAKRQRRRDEQQFSEEAERGRSVAERGTLENERASRSDAVSPGDESSSMLYESDVESPLEPRPSLQYHPSHIGYLTTSSPLVQTTTLPQATVADAQLDGAARAATYPPPTAAALAASASSTASLENTLKAPSNASGRRSPSPVGRIKQALTPRRSSTANPSPERRSGGTGAGVFKEKRFGGQRRRGSGSVSRPGSVHVLSEQSSSVSLPQAQSTSEPASPERPRTGKTQTIDTSAPPQTPPSSDTSAPIIVNTPPTPTDHSSAPRFVPDPRPEPPAPNPNVVTSPSGNMISHRRLRSGSATLVPSKLSNITSAPLTPTLESPAPPGSAGFFSSVFSAAQNAANTFSNSIANTSAAPSANRSRSGTQEVESPIVETFADKGDPDNPAEEKELAVKTLGMGDLSLSALGISEHTSGANTPVGSKFPDEVRGRLEAMNDDSSRAFGGPLSNGENGDVGLGLDDSTLTRPRSMYEQSPSGDQTPPNGSLFEGKGATRRSGSIRSAIGNNRRKRNSSATTGTTIGAAIAGVNSSLAHPSSGPKITGFAVASKKRNRDFHQLFRSVPDDDYLIEDYSCALQREILAHGRLYVSEGHLCFSSNIFGWVTTLVMSFDEIVSVEKRSTALLFKNGLMISTLHAKNVFASFTSRDSTYDLIVGIWKLGHPSLRSSLNGVSIEETGGGDKTEKYDGNAALGSQSGSESDSEGEDGDEVYDEDEDEEDGMSFTQAGGSVAGSDVMEKVVSRKPSAAVVTNGAPTGAAGFEGPGSPSGDFPGPATHAPTECSDQDTHHPKVLADELIHAPLGKIYSLMFGPASVKWMRNWLTSEQKCLELTHENDKPLGLDNKIRNYSYIKPLNGAIGPKQTKCICIETLDALDLDKAVSVTISTQTPDVPSGNVFSVKTKYCLTWGEGNTTRIQVNNTIEWTGKSWLKGPIEKGANDGQVQYTKDVLAALKAAVSTRRNTTLVAPGKKGKKGRKGRPAQSIDKVTNGAADSKAAADTWGLLEPLRPILEPLVDIVKPLITGNILYGLLVGLLVASWFRFGFPGRGSSRDTTMGFLATPDRIAAYEEIWRRQESELWEWLQDRVGTDRLREVGRMPMERQVMQGKLKDERMEEREVDAAIRVTEERLRVLKASVEKRKHLLKNTNEPGGPG